MIRYLRTFVSAAHTTSFSATGARLGLTQSAVSTQIKRLEQDLGCLLFDRAGKSVTLSQHGARLLPDAEHIVAAYDAMKAGVTGMAAASPLTVGAISTVQLGLLPRALQRFCTRYPGVHVNVVPGMSVQLLSLVDSQELDVAVMIRPNLGLPRHLKWIALMQEPYVAIAPAGQQGELAQVLHALPFIRYNRKSYGGQGVDQFLKRGGFDVHELMELDEPAVILQMVREGLGCAIIPAVLAGVGQESRVRVMPLPEPPLLREIGVLVRQSALKDAAVNVLVESLADCARELTLP